MNWAPLIQAARDFASANPEAFEDWKKKKSGARPDKKEEEIKHGNQRCNPG